MNVEKKRRVQDTYAISQKYSIPFQTTDNIVAEYIKYNKRKLLNGYRIDIPGLFYILPDVIKGEYKTTFAYDCYEIAKKLNIQKITVLNIIKEYLQCLKQNLYNGDGIELRGLASMVPIFNEMGNVVNIQASISTTIKMEISEKNLSINSARIHTYKSFREEIKNNNREV